MDIIFLLENLFHALGLSTIVLIYQKRHRLKFDVIKMGLLSIMISFITGCVFVYVINHSIYWILITYFDFVFLILFLDFKYFAQNIYYSFFVTTIICYIYLFMGVLSMDRFIIVDSLCYPYYIYTIYLSILLIILFMYIFNLKFFMPTERISVLIIFSSSLFLIFLMILYYLLQFYIISTNLCLFILIIFGMIFFSYNIIIQYLYNDYHQLMTMSQNNFISKITDSYINGIQKEQEKVYKIKHDIKNNLIILQHLINDNKIDDANKILIEINHHLEYKKSDIYTGNIFIDAYLINIINTSKINIKIKCSDLKELHYNPNIISIIINLVDNAVENAISKVDLYIKYENTNNLSIKVSNDCENDPTKLLKKSKKKGDHGYGLRIVKDIVNKYNGTYLTSYENFIFTTYVVVKTEGEYEK